MEKTLGTDSGGFKPDDIANGIDNDDVDGTASNNNALVGGGDEFKTASFGTGEPEKRSRGRPRKSGSDSGGSAGNGNTGGKASAKKLDIDTLANTLMFGHDSLAMMFGAKNPQLAQIIPITDKEARCLADAIIGLAKHYDIAPNPVVLAWINLCSAVGVVYLPKIAILKLVQNNNGQIN